MQSYTKHQLQFIKPAKTSKIEYVDKDILLISNSFDNGILQGECAPLPHLSSETIDDCIKALDSIKHYPTTNKELTDIAPSLPSALKFAFEGMLLENELGSRPINANPIKINGLIWMNGFDEMWNELEAKINAGFNCIKIKIGQHDFDAECRFLEKVRNQYGHNIQLRLDANGAFGIDDALIKLKDLSRFDIHSIEQPIEPGQWDAMEMVCKESRIPIGLDEELIDVEEVQQQKLIQKIKPDYLILKPSLHGGFRQCDNWIQHAVQHDIAWWATSALESNIGLHHIALWLSKYKISLPQGLGTGKLFKTNFERPFFYEQDLFKWKELN